MRGSGEWRRFRLGLHGRIVSLIVAVVVATGGAFTVLLIRSHHLTLHTELVERARVLSSLVATNAADPLALLDMRALRQLLADAVEQEDVVAAIVVDDRGRVLSDGTFDNPFRHRAVMGDLREVLSDGAGEVRVDDGLVVVTQPIRSGDRVLGAVRLTMSLARLHGEERALTMRAVGAGLLFMLLGLMLSRSVARAVTRPLDQLTEATSAVARGDFQRRLPPGGTDEVGRLADSFNEMTRRLRETTVSRDYIDHVLANMGEGLLVLDSRGSIRSANPVAVELLGRDEDRLIGRRLAEYVSADHGAGRRAIADSVAGEGREVETALVDAAGDRVPVVLSLTSMEGPGRSGVDLICVVRDIREQVEARRSLAASEERYRRLVELSPNGIFVCIEGRIAFANPAAASMLGAGDPEHLIGEPIVDRVVDGAAPAPDEVEHGGRYGDQTWRRLDGSTLDVEVGATLFRLRGRPAVQLVVFDATERKQMERMKDEFIAIASHELRTPLTSIHGSLGLILGGAVGELPPQVASLLEVAQRNCARLIRLINDMLDLQKIESGRMQLKPTSLGAGELLREAIDTTRGYAAVGDVEVVTTTGGDEAIVTGDPDRLLQVLTNLISNAVKYSPPGGTVEVGAEVVDETVRFSVANCGPRIPDGYRERIFHKFVQVDTSDTRRPGGTGLGLAICRAIVEMHGGTVDFSSDDDRTVFFFDLPLRRRAGD